MTGTRVTAVKVPACSAHAAAPRSHFYPQRPAHSAHFWLLFFPHFLGHFFVSSNGMVRSVVPVHAATKGKLNSHSPTRGLIVAVPFRCVIRVRFFVSLLVSGLFATRLMTPRKGLHSKGSPRGQGRLNEPYPCQYHCMYLLFFEDK